MRKITVLLMIFAFNIISSYAQYGAPNNPQTWIPMPQRIDANRWTDWTNAGRQGGIPSVFNYVVDITSFTGTFTQKLKQAIQSASAYSNALNNQLVVVRIPQGYFTVTETISIPSNIVLKGAGSDATTLLFQTGTNSDHCLLIKGDYPDSYYTVQSGSTMGSTTISLNNITGLSAGDYIDLRDSRQTQQNSGPTDYGIGQIVQINSISGNTLTLKDKLSIDHTGYTCRVYKLSPVSNVGIEDIHVRRADEGSGGGFNMSFLRAVNCWVKGCEIDCASSRNLNISTSSHISVKGNWVHDARAYDGTNGNGYGICLEERTTNCLIEDNFLNHLRHAILLHLSVNRNVISYNYSEDRLTDELFQIGIEWIGDLSLHGNYSHRNLFESNSFENILADDWYGDKNGHSATKLTENGPYNVFLRNESRITYSGPGTAPSNYMSLYACDYSTLYGNYATVFTTPQDFIKDLELHRAYYRGSYNVIEKYTLWAEPSTCQTTFITFYQYIQAPNIYSTYNSLEDISYYLTPAKMRELFSTTPWPNYEGAVHGPAYGWFNGCTRSSASPSYSPVDWRRSLTKKTLNGGSIHPIFNITRNDQTEFDGTSSAGVVAQIVEGNTGQITAPATKTLNGRTYNFAGWTDGDTTNPRTITQPTANATYTAFYKYPSHTNYYYTRYFNNQRKMIRTSDTTKLYQVYESSNKVWLEVSTNNGSTWTIANHGMPLNTGNAKCASLAAYGSSVGIVYQQQYGSGFKVMLRFFYPYANDYVGVGPYVVATEEDESYSLHANPVIGWGYNGKLYIVYEKKYDDPIYESYAGLRYYYGSSNGTNISWYSDGYIPGTDQNSRVPAIDCMQDPPGATSSFHILWWQTTGPASCSVYYDQVQWNTNNVLSFSTPQNVSSDLEYPGSGNENLIAYMSDTPQFIWKSEMYDYEDGDVYTTYSTVVLKSGNSHWEFGDDAVWPSIVKNKAEDFYAFSWQLSSGNYQFATSDDFTINTIGNFGYAAQLCPGASLTNMYLIGLGWSSPAYYFSNSNSLGSYYYKTSATGSYVGRFADINIKGKTFRLGLSDILVDNKSVDFVPIQKDDKITSLVQMNSVLESQPFQLSNNSTFDYSVVYKFADTLKAKSALGDNGYLNFKVELVDAATGKVLGTYDTLTYNKNQVRKRSLKAYEVCADGIGNKTVKLRMVINSNADISSVEAVQKYSTTSAMSKRSKKSIAYNGSVKVREYAISQNYPNPFNPSTMINYQIPKGGFVSLKVYDINGNEVANLVNETKESGRYSVEFNARNLASGVYFYRIISGDFVQTKKMAILK